MNRTETDGWTRKADTMTGTSSDPWAGDLVSTVLNAVTQARAGRTPCRSSIGRYKATWGRSHPSPEAVK